jgi:hypothetical protein
MFLNIERGTIQFLILNMENKMVYLYLMGCGYGLLRRHLLGDHEVFAIEHRAVSDEEARQKAQELSSNMNGRVFIYKKLGDFWEII